MISNRQAAVPFDTPSLQAFAKQLCSLLRLGRRRFDVAIVDDVEIRRLNQRFRGLARPTDVLSFPWQAPPAGEYEHSPAEEELTAFLGDIVISAETARRYSAGLPVEAEIRKLILHGLLHLLGHDHETDNGEMAAFERSLRLRLGIATAEELKGESQSSKKRMVMRPTKFSAPKPKGRAQASKAWALF